MATLKVTVHEARGLPVMDRTTGLADPYVILKLDDTEFNTEIVHRSRHPVWGLDFRFDAPDLLTLQEDPLEVRVYDHDIISRDDIVGFTLVDLNCILAQENPYLSGWFPLFDTTDGIRGEIRLTLRIKFHAAGNPLAPRVPERYVRRLPLQTAGPGGASSGPTANSVDGELGSPRPVIREPTGAKDEAVMPPAVEAGQGIAATIDSYGLLPFFARAEHGLEPLQLDRTQHPSLSSDEEGIFMFSMSRLDPSLFRVESTLTMVEELIVKADPEHSRLTNLRSVRTTNEARVLQLFKLSGKVRRQLSRKVAELQCNAVLGYVEEFDMEPNGIIVRAYGTPCVISAVRFVDDSNLHSLLPLMASSRILAAAVAAPHAAPPAAAWAGETDPSQLHRGKGSQSAAPTVEDALVVRGSKFSTSCPTPSQVATPEAVTAWIGGSASVLSQGLMQHQMVAPLGSRAPPSVVHVATGGIASPPHLAGPGSINSSMCSPMQLLPFAASVAVDVHAPVDDTYSVLSQSQQSTSRSGRHKLASRGDNVCGKPARALASNAAGTQALQSLASMGAPRGAQQSQVAPLESRATRTGRADGKTSNHYPTTVAALKYRESSAISTPSVTSPQLSIHGLPPGGALPSSAPLSAAISTSVGPFDSAHPGPGKKQAHPAQTRTSSLEVQPVRQPPQMPQAQQSGPPPPPLSLPPPPLPHQSQYHSQPPPYTGYHDSPALGSDHPNHAAASTRAHVVLLTMKDLPSRAIVHIAGHVCARSVKIVAKMKSKQMISQERDAWWIELREEIKANARAFHCNAVLGYEEEVLYYEDVAVLSISGTAIVLDVSMVSSRVGPEYLYTRARERVEQGRNCGILHLYQGQHRAQRHLLSEVGELFNNNLCNICHKKAVPEVIIASCMMPLDVVCDTQPQLLHVVVTKAKPPLKGVDLALSVSQALPYIEYSLHKQLLFKMRFYRLNAVFGVRISIAISANTIIGMLTGTGCLLAGLPVPLPPSIEVIDPKILHCTPVARLREVVAQRAKQRRSNRSTCRSSAVESGAANPAGPWKRAAGLSRRGDQRAAAGHSNAGGGGGDEDVTVDPGICARVHRGRHRGCSSKNARRGTSERSSSSGSRSGRSTSRSSGTLHVRSGRVASQTESRASVKERGLDDSLAAGRPLAGGCVTSPGCRGRDSSRSASSIACPGGARARSGSSGSAGGDGVGNHSSSRRSSSRSRRSSSSGNRSGAGSPSSASRTSSSDMWVSTEDDEEEEEAELEAAALPRRNPVADYVVKIDDEEEAEVMLGMIDFCSFEDTTLLTIPYIPDSANIFGTQERIVVNRRFAFGNGISTGNLNRCFAEAKRAFVFTAIRSAMRSGCKPERILVLQFHIVAMFVPNSEALQLRMEGVLMTSTAAHRMRAIFLERCAFREAERYVSDGQLRESTELVAARSPQVEPRLHVAAAEAGASCGDNSACNDDPAVGAASLRLLLPKPSADPANNAAATTAGAVEGGISSAFIAPTGGMDGMKLNPTFHIRLMLFVVSNAPYSLPYIMCRDEPPLETWASTEATLVATGPDMLQYRDRKNRPGIVRRQWQALSSLASSAIRNLVDKTQVSSEEKGEPLGRSSRPATESCVAGAAPSALASAARPTSGLSEIPLHQPARRLPLNLDELEACDHQVAMTPQAFVAGQAICRYIGRFSHHFIREAYDVQTPEELSVFFQKSEYEIQCVVQSYVRLLGGNALLEHRMTYHEIWDSDGSGSASVFVTVTGHVVQTTRRALVSSPPVEAVCGPLGEPTGRSQ